MALREDEVKRLHGAALSGQLSKTMGVRFVVNGGDAIAAYDELQIKWNTDEPSVRLNKRRLYG